MVEVLNLEGSQCHEQFSSYGEMSNVVSPKPVPASNIVFPSTSMSCQKYSSKDSDVS